MKQKVTKRLPTIEEWNWLMDNCKWEWDEVLKGQKVTSDNGNSIFLPAVGSRGEFGLNSVGVRGYYWSSSISPKFPNSAYAVAFSSGNAAVYSGSYYGYYEFSIRPVSDEPQEGFVDMGNGLYWAKEKEPGLFTYPAAMKLYTEETQDDAEESYTATGWIARDSVDDNYIGLGLCLYYKKPTRCGREWVSKDIAMHLSFDEFPSLRWEDEPAKVEITIKRK